VENRAAADALRVLGFQGFRVWGFRVLGFTVLGFTVSRFYRAYRVLRVVWV
jgi:hypothetical protein